MLSPFFLLFWALRSMTQFETDTGYVNEELQRAFQTRLLFLRWLPFSHLSAAFERGGQPPLVLRLRTLHSGLEPCLQRCHFSEQVAVAPSLPQQGGPVPSEPPSLLQLARGVRR